MQRLATAPGCVLGHLCDAGCARSQHADSREGNGASWACAIREEEMLTESCQLSGRQRITMLECGLRKFRVLSKCPEMGLPIPPGISESKEIACRASAQ
ncbi:hypothetical protein BCY84_13972 [Trypanosoma cruzi cruzi]|nr:hypothetical protein BCY84_13972 [Trypanosoma cruzi cruzi]